MSGSRGKSRSLSDGERILWREITRSIAPLRPGAVDEFEAMLEREAQPVIAAKARPLKPHSQLQPAKQKPEAPPALSPLGRRAKQRVARGHDTIDGRLDLHGLTQAEAHGALLRFLHTAQTRGAKMVIVITGKGRGGEIGVLRRQVPFWLALPEFRAIVVGFDEAHHRHGGEGALYLRLRRSRATE
jgi:DNA-nicking Smr family endonuclease